MRAAILEARGLAEAVPLAECTPQTVADALLDVLEEEDYPEGGLPPLDGADRAAGALLELVE